MMEKTRRRKTIPYVVLALAILCFIPGVMKIHGGYSYSELEIPDRDQVLEEGYPENESGETYGPDIKNMDEPDLLLAMGQNGTMGYVRQEDVMGLLSENPEEALKLNDLKSRFVPLYLQDGDTVIGKFLIETGKIAEG